MEGFMLKVRFTSLFFILLVFLGLGWGESAVAQSMVSHDPGYEIQPDSLHLRPQWSFQLNSSLGTFQGKELNHLTEFSSATTIGVRFQYQPTFLQLLGVFSVGPTLEIFPFSSLDPGVLRTPSSWAVGGEARYQLRLFHKQGLVPTAAFHSQYLAYQLADGTSGRAVVRGPSFGVLFLLNAIDPAIASDFYQTYGALRTYALLEMKTYLGNDHQVSFFGKSLFFGLRIEY